MSCRAPFSFILAFVLGLVVNPPLLYARELQTTSVSKPKYILVFLGDSLTDTGNDYKASGLPIPLIYSGPGGLGTGRFCNGLIWVDYLNATLSKGYDVQVVNYAYGGATACADPITESSAPFIKNLTSQTDSFIQDVKAGKIPVDANTKVIVFVWIGSNDFVNALDRAIETGAFPTEAQLADDVQMLTACRVGSLQALATRASIVTDVVMLPVSPMHLSPGVPANLKDQVATVETRIGRSTAGAVEQLQKTLDSLPTGSPGAGVKVHMLGKTSNWIVRLAEKIKPPFKHMGDESCFYTDSALITDVTGITVCSNPEDYMFYDPVHPTTRFHEWFTKKGLIPRLQNLGLLPSRL